MMCIYIYDVYLYIIIYIYIYIYTMYIHIFSLIPKRHVRRPPAGPKAKPSGSRPLWRRGLARKIMGKHRENDEPGDFRCFFPLNMGGYWRLNVFPTISGGCEWQLTENIDAF